MKLALVALLALPTGNPFVTEITDGQTSIYCNTQTHSVQSIKIVADKVGTYTVNLSSRCALSV